MSVRYCSNCGKPLPPDAVSCPSCGARVVASTRSQDSSLGRPPMARRQMGVFVGLAAAFLAFSTYIVITTRDLSAIFVGVVIVAVIYFAFMFFRVQPSRVPPAPPPLS